MQLPSNNIAKLFIGAVLVVSGIITFSIIDKKSSENNPEQIVDLSSGISVKRNLQSDTTDTDLDGLLDWQEDLWGSDPKNPDSDSDGTNDGAEVDAGRSPVVPAPNDSLEEIRKEENKLDQNIYEHYVPGTITDSLSKNLFNNYIKFKQEGTYNVKTQAEIVEAIAQDVNSITKEDDVYSKKDITVVASTNESLKNYGDNFALIQNKYTNQIAEINIPDETLYIETLSQSYKNFGKELSKLLVPTSVSDTHIKIINNLNVVGQSLVEISTSETDPVKGLFAIKNYENAATEQQNLYITLAEYFKRNGIIFSNETPSNLWNILIQ